MADEVTALPVESPLRITVRPSRLQDELDFADRLAGLPVEQPFEMKQIEPVRVGRLPVKVEEAIKTSWPARMIQSGISLPKDVYEGKVDPLSEEGIQRTQDLAGMSVVGPLAMKPGTATLGSGMTRNIKMAKDIYGNELTDYHGNPIPVGPDGKITMYHRTSTPEAKEAIYNTGKFKSKENTDETFFSDNLESEYGKGFGDHVVAVKIDPKYVRLNDQFPNGENHYAVPNKYLNKSVLFSDSGTPGSGIAAVANSQKAPAFYSAVEEAISKTPMKNGTKEQWINAARKYGATSEEIQYTNLNDLPKGQISKTDLEKHIVENKVQLEEVTKADFKPEDLKFSEYSKDLDKVAEAKFGKLYDHLTDSQQQQIRLEAFSNQNIHPTKYSKWQLPGGENYKETLLTLPLKTSPKAAEAFAITKRMQEGEFNSLNETQRREVFTNRDRLLKEARLEEGEPYRSSHWDEPNVLAHIRHNDRDIPGVGKTLHIEEIQSDWHQAGRKQGYKDAKPLTKEQETRAIELNNKVQEMRSKGMSLDDVLNTTEGQELSKLQDIHSAFVRQDKVGAVPDAPFKKTWDELALKRMIHKAASEGYDSISWTPGEAQAARYDLSKQISRLHYTKTDKGYILAPETHTGQEAPVNNGLPIPKEKLADYIGKEIAEKIINNEGMHKGSQGVNTLENVDLKVGGEGMKAFYDKMLVDKANAIAKKFGGKVETKKVDVIPGGAREMGDVLERKDNPDYKMHPVHVLRITPQMREHALTKGFPLFSGGLPVLVPVAHDPFKHKLIPVDHNPFTNPNAT